MTALYVFSCYLFSYATSNQDSKTITKVSTKIKTIHAYLPTTIISDKGSTFVSHVIKEVAGVLGINERHATTKHAQMIGTLERPQASIKQALKIEAVEQRSFGINTSALRSFIITLFITQALAVNQTEYFMDDSLKCPRFESRHPSSKSTHSQFANCSRCF